MRSIHVPRCGFGTSYISNSPLPLCQTGYSFNDQPETSNSLLLSCSHEAIVCHGPFSIRTGGDQHTHQCRKHNCTDLCNCFDGTLLEGSCVTLGHSCVVSMGHDCREYAVDLYKCKRWSESTPSAALISEPSECRP